MPEPEERIALILLAGVLIAVLAAHLLLGYIGKPEFASPYSDTSKEGDLVVLQGQADGVHSTNSGGHLIIEVGGVTVFVPGAIAGEITVNTGDQVTVCGTIQTYQGEKEIVISSPEDITVNRESLL